MDENIMKDTMKTAATKPDAPIVSALSSVNETILALEKQLDILYSRLSPISSRIPSDSTSEPVLDVYGNSDLASSISGHYGRLQSISDFISKMTRELEI